MQEHQDRIGLVRKAREILRDLAFVENPADTEKFSAEIWAGVMAKLDTIPMARTNLPIDRPGLTVDTPGLSRHRRRWSYLAAACLLGLIIAGAALKYYRSHNRPVIEVATLVMNQDLRRTNQTRTDREVLLVDGSKVILQPGASIRHAAFFQKDKREVFLDGNAFFEIAKDASRPFYVYTKDLVLHVLGTSFNVTTNKDNGDITVLVQSGKIAVSKASNPSKQQLILVSNQQALYKEQTHDLIQNSPVEMGKEVPYKPSAEAPIPFNFEAAPVVEIFQTLENAYGIPLHYDKLTFASCTVTTSLTEETFEERLKIICEAIGATYKIEGNGVFIDGKPCKE